MKNCVKNRIICFSALLLSILLLTGCFQTPSQEIETTPEPVVSTTVPTPATVSVDVTVTETERPVETPLPTPAPTDTPVPNPYAGTWTVLNRPFSLTLRPDGTYEARYRDQTLEGTYLFDEVEVTLEVPGAEPVLLPYAAEADLLRSETVDLIRSELIAEADVSNVPVSFEAQNDAVRVRVRGAVVEAELKTGTAQQYCFCAQGCSPKEDGRDWFDVSDSGEPQSLFRVFKYDGAYTLRIKDAAGTLLPPVDLTVASGYTYPIDAQNIEPARIPIEHLLVEYAFSVEELNREIATNAAAAGLYTRAGAVTAGVSLISRMAKNGYAIPYQGSGTYHAGRDWGVNPNWGMKVRGTEKTYVGMHDVASIIWAYKQAGLNLYALGSSVSIASLGERERKNDNRIDYDRAESGDLIRNGRHYMMVIDRLDRNADGEDDAYLVYEMRQPVLGTVVYPFSEIKKREFYSMDAFFAGTGKNQDKVNYWTDRFRIPSDDLPEDLIEATEAERIERQYRTFLNALGF